MRIVMVSARYSPFVGGVETHVHEVGTRMAALGHQVTVLTTDPIGSLPAEETFCEMRIKRVKAWPRNQDYHFSPRIYTEIRRGQYDLVHFQGYNSFVAPIGMLAAIRGEVPFVLTFHSGGHSSRLRNAVRGVQHVVLSPLVARASHLIGVSAYEAEFFSKRMRVSPERFSIVPNGASLPPPSNPPPVADPNLVLSVGRLERYKGHHRAIEALPHLRRTVPDARLMIVGSGPYEHELRALVRSLDLEGCVSFDSVPSSERRRFTNLLCSAGLIVLLSKYEAHPVAVMEALSVRRPVLVSDTTGMREIAQKGLCRSIPLDASPGAVAAAIAAELTGDHMPPEVALPNWDDCAHQLLQIYDAVLSRCSRVPISTRMTSSALKTITGEGEV